MRKTFFWTALYSTMAYAAIAAYNVWFDRATNVNIDFDHSPAYVREIFDILRANQDQITNNQQLTHVLVITVLIFLIVQFYYIKHPSGGLFSASNRGPRFITNSGPSAGSSISTSSVTTSTTTAKEEIKQVHPDIPDRYYEDPTKYSVNDRLTENTDKFLQDYDEREGVRKSAVQSEQQREQQTQQQEQQNQNQKQNQKQEGEEQA